MATVSEALKATIEARGMTADRLARRSGVCIDSILRFMSGERGLSVATFDRLVHAMGLELVERKGSRRREEIRRTTRPRFARSARALVEAQARYRWTPEGIAEAEESARYMREFFESIREQARAEAMRPGLRGARAEDAETLEAVDLLGLTWPCDGAALRAAYRRRAKEVHPDAGGSPEEFRRVRAAYEHIQRLV